MSNAYIVPVDLLATDPPRCEYHAHGIPADPSLSLVVVKWGDDTNAEAEFESLPDVLWLGNKWDPLPDAAVPLIASLQDAAVEKVSSGVVKTPVSDVPAIPDTVSTAVRKTAWPAARLIR